MHPAAAPTTRDEPFPVRTRRRLRGIRPEHRTLRVPDTACRRNGTTGERRATSRPTSRRSRRRSLAEPRRRPPADRSRRPRHAAPPLTRRDPATQMNVNPQLLDFAYQSRVRIDPRIDYRGHPLARFEQRQRRQVGAVVVRHDHGPSPDRDAVVDDVIAHRARQDDAGQVVAGEAQRPFDRIRSPRSILSARTRQTRCRGPSTSGRWSAHRLVAENVSVIVDPRSLAASRRRSRSPSLQVVRSAFFTQSAAGIPSIAAPSTGARPPQ